MNPKKLVLAISIMTLSGAAYAGPFKLNVGAFGNVTVADPDTVTEDINELGLTGTLATSIYQAPDFASLPGATVIDTNIKSEIESLAGMAIGGNRTTIDGSSVSLLNVNPSPSTEINIDALTTVDTVPPFDKEGFSGDYSGTWSLDFNYYFKGVLGASSTVFDEGYFDIYFVDNSNFDRTKVARLVVEGSDLSQGNLFVSGYYTGDFNGNGIDDDGLTDFQKNFFIDSKNGKTFWQLWDEGVGDPGITVSWTLDTNVNPPLPAEDQLVLFDNGTLDTADDVLIRQTTLDSSITFDVPEPGTLMLLGVGLLGLGSSLRRKAQA